MENNLIPSYDSASIYPFCKCLSSSQFLLYESNPQEFFMRYELGVGGRMTPAMNLGRIFSACYQNRSLDAKAILSENGFAPRIIELFIAALACFPVQKYGSPELPMRCEFNGWEFRATLDDYIEKTLTVIENKTGQTEWNQERVNFSDQITFQAWTHWKLKGIPPRKIILNWWNTKNRNLDVRTFKTSRSLGCLRNFDKRVEVVVQNIEAKNFTNPLY